MGIGQLACKDILRRSMLDAMPTLKMLSLQAIRYSHVSSP